MHQHQQSTIFHVKKTFRFHSWHVCYKKQGNVKSHPNLAIYGIIFPGTCNYKGQQKFEMSQWTTICHTMVSDGLKVNERQIWHRIISSFVLGYKDNPVKFLESDAHWLRITGWGADSSTSIYVTLWNVSLKDKYKQRKSDGPFCFIAVVKLKQWWPCCDILCMRPPSQDKRDMRYRLSVGSNIWLPSQSCCLCTPVMV